MTQCEAEAPGFNWAQEEKRREGGGEEEQGLPKLSFQATPWNHPPSSYELPGVLPGGQEAVYSPYSDTSTQTAPFPGHTKQELPLGNPF